MANIIIFGVQDFAQLAHFYLTTDSEHEVVAFTVNQAYMPEENTFCGLPVIAFEEISKHFPPEEFQCFAPMAPHKMNRVREKTYKAIKSQGYQCISYLSSRATILSQDIGDNCFILEDNTIQPFTQIGNNVILWSGNHIGHHSVIENHVMFTSHVVISGHCHIKPYCTLGVNASIRDGLTLAEGTFVAMGSWVARNTEAWSFYKGKPALKATTSTKDFD